MMTKEKTIVEILRDAIEEAAELGIDTLEWDEDRIDIISQNGNDGLHYEEIT